VSENFINTLNDKYGTPNHLAIDVAKGLTKNKNIFEQGGMAICASKFPEIPVYAGIAGATSGVLVTLLLVFIYNTFFRRRKPQVIVVNNTDVPVTVSATTTPDVKS
jgi:hypothetical protein